MNHAQGAIERFVRAVFEAFCTEQFYFHNICHTAAVAKRCKEIGGFEVITEEQASHLETAAWFHDIGYLFAPAEVHEEKSVEVMVDFASEAPDACPDPDLVASMIRSTKMPTDPKTQSEKILCDADTYHFGTDEFLVSNDLVFRELNARYGSICPGAFLQGTIAMLEHHRFYTAYCCNMLAAGKAENLSRLVRELAFF